MTREELAAVLDANPLMRDALDEAVVEVKLDEASQINQGGYDYQLHYLFRGAVDEAAIGELYEELLESTGGDEEAEDDA